MEKMRFLLLLSFFSLVSIASADEVKDTTESKSELKATQNRKSRIRLAIFSGREKYQESELSASIGVNSIWAFTGALGVEKSDGIPTASSFSLGANAKFTPDFDASIALQSRREPESVVARGMSLGMNWNFASLWNGVLASEIGLQATVMRYKQDEGIRTRVRDGGIAQTSLALLFSQELSEALLVSSNYTAYDLGGANANELSQAISSRPSVNPGFLSVVEGFPKRAYGLGTELQLKEDWSMGLQLFKTDYFNGSHSRGFSISNHFEFNSQWSAGVGVSGTKNDSDDSKSGLLELSVAYQF